MLTRNTKKYAEYQKKEKRRGSVKQLLLFNVQDKARTWDIKTHGSEACGHETMKCTPKLKRRSHYCGYLHVGTVLQY